MEKFKKVLLFGIWLLGHHFTVVYAQNKVIDGVVYDQHSGLVLPDVVVLVENTGVSTVTDSTGRFAISSPSEIVSLRFSKLGYASVANRYHKALGEHRIYMQQSTVDIEEVEINTGYQRVPRERATGSFVHIGREQIETVPGRSVVDRLDGVMPGLQFDKRVVGPTSTGRPVITVRGMNTFSTGSSATLIVVDNFPYEGDIETINPNDVESVTLLRDAAATSIWGARAGNGVLVINLKKPDQSGRTAIGWTSNVSVTGKPDLYYNPTMSSTEFVDVELFLYDNNYYRAALTGANAHRTVFSPVVQALYDLERGKIDQERLESILTDARIHDYRDDMLEHYYRPAINQQHHASISKKTGSHSLRFSMGWDRSDGINNMAVGQQHDTRYSFNLFNEFQFSKRMSASFNVGYTIFDSDNVGGHSYPLNPQGGKFALYPYARLIDGEGQALPIPYGLNANYADTVGRGDLLDWRFRPFEDREHQIRDARSARINPMLMVRYNPVASLYLEAMYSGDMQSAKEEMRHGLGSYEVRNQVNLYTEVNGDQVLRHFPVGEIYVPSFSDLRTHRFRFNAKMDESIFGTDRLTWVLGGELSDVKTSNSSHRVYGYNPYTATSVPVDHVYRYPMYMGGVGTIPNGHNFNWGVRRLVSFFGNAAYSMQDKYIVSGSIRRDASNVFGAKANERWNPLWSVGLSWNLHRENFMKNAEWVSNLRLRITHGHSGNLGGGTTSDRVVISHSMNAPLTGLPYATISSPPNNSLKWEDVQMRNYGLDFGLLGGKVGGSIEYFSKRVTDLISRDPIDPTTGFLHMDRNVAGIKGKGVDIAMNFTPFARTFNWRIGTSFSYVKDWTTEFYGLEANTLALVGSDNTVRPIVDRALVPVHSFRFAGLDPANGDPQGILNGEISKNYTALLRDSLHNLIYHGSGRPLYHGFLNHTFQYRGVSLFVNMAFRAGHYYKRPTISYNSLFGTWRSHNDFAKRWQQPGDEQHTTVPSMVYPGNTNRDNFYANSEVNVSRADVVRLQQIRLSYRWVSPLWNIKSIDVGIHASNLGVLWKASDGEMDPDYLSIPPSRVITTSLSVQF